MPNQRSKDKTYLGGFVEKSLHRKLVRMAKASGMAHNKFGFVTQLIQESLARRRLRPARRRKAPPAKG